MGQFSLSTVAQQPRSCRPFQCHVKQMHVPLVVVLSLIFRVECHHLLTNGTAAFSGHLNETTCILFIFLFGTWLHTTTIERSSSFVTLKFCHRGHPGDLHMPGRGSTFSHGARISQNLDGKSTFEIFFFLLVDRKKIGEKIPPIAQM